MPDPANAAYHAVGGLDFRSASPAIRRAQEQIWETVGRRMREQRTAETKDGARLMLRTPWHLSAALERLWLGGRPIDLALDRCAQFIAAQEAHGRADRPDLYSPARLVGLRQARLALRWMRRNLED